MVLTVPLVEARRYSTRRPPKAVPKQLCDAVVVTRMVHGRLVKVSRVVRVKTVPSFPRIPMLIASKKFKKALADKGYFKGEVNGSWDADSIAAMKQFQSDKKTGP